MQNEITPNNFHNFLHYIAVIYVDNTFEISKIVEKNRFYIDDTSWIDTTRIGERIPREEQEEAGRAKFPEFHSSVYAGSLCVAIFADGYKTSVGGGEKEGGWRKREKVRIVNWIWRLARWALSRWHERHYFIRPDTSRAGQAKRRKMIAASHQGSSSGLEI